MAKKIKDDFGVSLTDESNFGVSLNSRSRLVFSKGAQTALGLEAEKRNLDFYVEIKTISEPKNEEDRYKFYLGFHLKSEKHKEATQRFYKPKISARKNLTSYIEMAKFIIKAGLVEKIEGKTQAEVIKDEIVSGSVKIIDFSKKNSKDKYLIISLFKNFKRNL